jgi:hypothetical protein
MFSCDRFARLAPQPKFLKRHGLQQNAILENDWEATIFVEAARAVLLPCMLQIDANQFRENLGIKGVMGFREKPGQIGVGPVNEGILEFFDAVSEFDGSGCHHLRFHGKLL